MLDGKFMESLSRFVARSITIMGSIGGTACAWIANNPDASKVWQGLAVIGLGSAIAGGIGWFRADKRLKKDYAKRREQRMIAVAKQKHGRITDVELVAEPRYPLEECREFLTDMTTSGSAEMQIGKEGTMVYVFPGFLSAEEKRGAQSATTWQPKSRQSSQDAPPPLEDNETTSKSLELE